MKRYCGPAAIAIATGDSYRLAENAIRMQRPGVHVARVASTWNDEIAPALAHLGHDCERKTPTKSDFGTSVRSLRVICEHLLTLGMGRNIPVILYTADHFLVLKDGRLQDEDSDTETFTAAPPAVHPKRRCRVQEYWIVG